MRRPLIIAGIVVIFLIVAIGAYFLFFHKSTGGIEVGGDPFGNTASGDIPGGSETPSVLDDGIDFAGQAGEQVAPRLVRITGAPVAFGSLARYIPEIPAATSTDGTVTPAVPPDVEVRFIERQSGNVYAYRAYAHTLTRISNQTIPGVKEAIWMADGSRAFLRFLSNEGGAEHLQTFALSADGGQGYFLEDDLAEVAATSSTSVLTLAVSTTGSLATVARADGSNPQTAFSSAVTRFTIAFFGKTYLATTKASASVDGYTFTALSNGTLSRLIGPVRGLAAIGGPQGSRVIYSGLDRGALGTYIFDIPGKLSEALPVRTLAEKCIFANEDVVYCAVPKTLSGTLPDDWYQGVVSFSDRIWKIDLTTRTASLVVDPSSVASINIDAVSLSVDPTNDFLTFTNRIDGSLWIYDL